MTRCLLVTYAMRIQITGSIVAAELFVCCILTQSAIDHRLFSDSYVEGATENHRPTYRFSDRPSPRFGLLLVGRGCEHARPLHLQAEAAQGYRGSDQGEEVPQRYGRGMGS